MGLSNNFRSNNDGDYPLTEIMTHMFICPKLIGRQLDLTALHMLIDRKNSGQGLVESGHREFYHLEG
jgi:hypothetical protein